MTTACEPVGFGELAQLETVGAAGRLAELAGVFDGWRPAALAELAAAENRGEVDDDTGPGLAELRGVLSAPLSGDEGAPDDDGLDGLEPAGRAALALADRLASLPSWGDDDRRAELRAELRKRLRKRLDARRTGGPLSALFRLWHAIPSPDGKARKPGAVVFLADPAWRAPVPANVPGPCAEAAPRTPMPAAERLAALTSPATTEAVARVWFEGRRLAWVDPEAVAAVLRQVGAGGELPTVLCHRLIRWILARACERMAAGSAVLGGLDWRVIRVEGGIAGLASDMRIRKSDDRRRLGELLRLLSAVPIPAPDGSQGQLIALRERRARGALRAELSITVCDALFPTEAAQALTAELRHRRSARFLVPLPEALPPRVGRPPDHAAQLSMQIGALAWMREHAAGMDGAGFLAIPARAWRELGKAAGVPAVLIDRVVTAWCEGDADAAPFLERDGAGRFRVADATARGSLIEGGERTREGEQRARQAHKRGAA